MTGVQTCALPIFISPILLYLNSPAETEEYPPFPTTTGADSSIVFHAPQAVQRPFHLGYSCPHSRHINNVLGFAKTTPPYLKQILAGESCPRPTRDKPVLFQSSAISTACIIRNCMVLIYYTISLKRLWYNCPLTHGANRRFADMRGHKGIINALRLLYHKLAKLTTPIAFLSELRTV